MYRINKQPLRFFVQLKIVLLALLFSFSAQAHDVQLDDNSLLGFRHYHDEIAINPCLDATLVHNAFGASALNALEQAKANWPSGLCQSELKQMLFIWNYFSTVLIANTERPTILAKEIQSYNEQLSACKSLLCLKGKLPRLVAWAHLVYDRSPVDSAPNHENLLAISGEAVVYPGLALRGIRLPLSEQLMACGGEKIEDLTFNLINANLLKKPMVQVKCANASDDRVWLLEANIDPVSKVPSEWKEIFSNSGEQELYVLVTAKVSYPTIYAYYNRKGIDRVSVFDYNYMTNAYKKTADFGTGVDSYGKVHAFIGE